MKIRSFGHKRTTLFVAKISQPGLFVRKYKAWRARFWSIWHSRHNQGRRNSSSANNQQPTFSFSYFRGKDNLTSNMMGEVMRQVKIHTTQWIFFHSKFWHIQVFEKGGTVTTVSNFPAFERSLNHFFPGQVTPTCCLC